jgi:DNA-binding response OmpR family regulator
VFESHQPAMAPEEAVFQSRILIACADRAERDYLAELFADQKATLDFAGDRSEVRTKVRALIPDVLVLGRMETDDVGSVGTAFDICREFKGDSRTARTMILMIVDRDEADIEQAVLAGADDLLSRPVTRRELLPRVNAMLALKDVRDRRNPL